MTKGIIDEWADEPMDSVTMKYDLERLKFRIEKVVDYIWDSDTDWEDIEQMRTHLKLKIIGDGK